MKKKLKIAGIIAGVIIFFMIIGLFTGGTLEKEAKEKAKTEENNKKMGDVFLRLECTMKEEKENKSGNKVELEYKIELKIDNDVLMTKKDTTTWKDPEKETCDFYKKRAEIYNDIKGIKDTVECTAEGGERITEVVFKDLDTKQARFAEQKYVREDTTFDKDSYKTLRLNEGYRCTEYEGEE